LERSQPAHSRRGHLVAAVRADIFLIRRIRRNNELEVKKDEKFALSCGRFAR